MENNSKKLREQAKDELRQGKKIDTSLYKTDLKVLVEELSIYQIELEHQNQELILSQEHLQQSKDRYLDLFDNAPIGYLIVDSIGVIKDINQTACLLLENSKHEFVNNKITKIIHPDFQDIYYLYFQTLINKKHIQPCDIKIRKSNNIYFYARIQGLRQSQLTSEEPEFRLAIFDVTIQKEMELKLLIAKEHAEESEEKYRLLHENAGIGIGYYTPEGVVISYNSLAAKHMNGISEDFIGKSIFDLFPKQAADFYLKRIKKALTSVEPLVYEDFVQLQADEKYFLSTFTKIVNSQKKVVGIQIISQDITKIKNAEIELFNAKVKAEESDRLKSAFLANMSHEIRTPMNGILGFADLLKEPGLDGNQQQEYIRIIEKSGTRMLNIINDIVDISKIEAGLMKLDIKESNINEQIEYIYTFFKTEVDTKGMKLSFRNALPAKEAIIKTDREKVYSILTNLVKNAIKYSKEGTIELGYERKGKDIEFFVRDTGIGIPQDRQEAIFERFIQADIADLQARQGAGLGLSIAKAYTEMLGGKIWVESEEGIGSTFYFTLPYNAEPEEKAFVKTSDFADGIVFTTKTLKILIAEDDETSEMLISLMVNVYCKEKLKVRTGLEAVEISRKNPDIDLILMDIQMPVMGGYEAIRQIRGFNKDVIIIAQTAYGLSGDKEKAIAAGCNDYISKPINRNTLMVLLQKYFN